MNREELVEAILNAHNIAREHCRNTDCRNCKNFSAPMSYCMELVAADYLISLGLGVRGELKLPHPPGQDCAICDNFRTDNPYGAFMPIEEKEEKKKG